ncbi:hypothetical protein TRIATDRAFT_297538 [Trichoderma atroviride IMI 206040]|uniref:RING-type domain-containing protein n=1 Tax=Hypocrea atroviridis (strain ATCC 20476 / IMI 206040) TaxID=452589 RepID=G9NII2_HYPAI|nr:uncharacterized protein TRIATDRAFT_297538 [Trichoderma atroviride IMI 206040]EHK49594.1 hypothetical protein TRIATDRAFT_297538 [Trichoderma atroviride IMI 206040]
MLDAGSSTHHCPVCKKSAKSRCMNQGHLKTCAACGRAWSPSFETECPYCRNAKEKEEQRKAKE